MARPTKLDKELQDRFIAAIQAGNDKKVAAQMVGIGETTLYRWLSEGSKEDADQEFREFRELVIRAEAQAEVSKVAQVTIAVNNGEWKAATWWLERKHPERWAQTQRIQTEISGPNGGPIKLSVDDMKKAILESLKEGTSYGIIGEGESTTSS